ncbi:MAG: biopolymer transporter ExbD [Robiginitomaculum sp.]|nr:biopolymer transporter ExbD [Robiginitomaculum sp.]MDQ7078060.1 biopolymer transporter ExbD [Robiginitomaculum sp.]
MARSRTVSKAEEVEMDMTPMLDVVFILLIFFIVTAVFVKEPGVDVNKPLWSPEVSAEKPSIMVAVASDNQIWINKKIVPKAGVSSVLEKMKAENPKAEGVIQGDQLAKIGTVLDIQDVFIALGIPVKVSIQKK